MKIFFNIIIFLSLLSCKEIIKKEKTITPNISLSNKENIQTANGVVKKIKSLPIQKMPYEFIDCSADSLSNLELSEPLYKALRINIDSLTILDPKKDTLFYILNKGKIYKETKAYAPKYYYFLLDYIEKPTIISFSNSYLYKRLTPIRNDIEVLLILTRIYDNNFGRQNVRGLQIDVMTYNPKAKKSIDRKRLITTGIGLEDIAYHECFQINNEYDITTKSYMHLEDEATSIERNLKIDSLGKISVLNQNVKITD